MKKIDLGDIREKLKHLFKEIEKKANTEDLKKMQPRVMKLENQVEEILKRLDGQDREIALLVDSKEFTLRQGAQVRRRLNNVPDRQAGAACVAQRGPDRRVAQGAKHGEHGRHEQEPGSREQR